VTGRARTSLAPEHGGLRSEPETPRVAFWDWDLQRDVIRWSGAVAEVLGPATPETLGSFATYATIIHPADRPLVEGAVADATQGPGETHDVEYRILRPDIGLRWVRDIGRITRHADGSVERFTGSVVDVHEQRTALEGLRTSEERSRRLAEATDALARAEQDLDVLLPLAARLAGEALRGPTLLRLIADDRVHFGRCAVHFPPPGVGDALRSTLEREQQRVDAGFSGEVLRAGRALLVRGADLQGLRSRIHHPMRRFFDAYGVTAIAGVPIRSGDRMLGTLVTVRGGDAEPLADDEVRELEDFASRIAVAMENAALFREAEQSGELARRYAGQAARTLRLHHLALDVGRMVVWEWEIDADVLRWSGDAAAVLGVDEPPRDKMAYAALVHPDDLDVLAGAVLPAVRHGERYDAEYRIVPREGEVRWVRGIAEKLTGERGARRLVGILMDTTRVQRAEEQLRRTDDHLRLASEAVAFGTWEWDIETGEVSWTETLQRMFGLPEGEFGWRYEDFVALIHPGDRDRLDAAVARALAHPDDEYWLEHRVVRHGDVRWFLARGHVLTDAEGRPRWMTGVTLDITDRKRAEAEIDRRSLQQDAVASLSQLALHGTRVDAVAEAATRVVAETLQVERCGLFQTQSSGELLLRTGVGWDGGDVGTLSVPPSSELARGEEGRLRSDLRGHREGYAVVVHGRQAEYGRLVVSTDGPRAFSEEELTFLRSVANVLAGAVVRRQTEDELLEAQKMEAIGRLSGGIAHDFNNLLTVMLGFGELLEPAVASDPEARTDLEELLAAGTRAADLVDQLLTFSRGRPTEHGSCDVAEVVRGLDVMLGRVLGDDVEVTASVAPDPAWVRLHAIQVEQILINLAVNARDAMPDGGRLHIGVDRVEGDVRLVVSDTGTGMDDMTRTHAFEPFFSTKTGRKGTGLGLSSVYGLVSAAGGRVELESGPGAGTVVTIHLPHEDAPSATTSTPVPERAPAVGGVGAILLVEDNAQVRRLTRDVLTGAGYVVLSASNGREAAELARDAAFDVLVTDVVMPHESGVEVAMRLRRRSPSLPVVFLSGHVDGAPLEEVPGAVFLAKPFRSDQLVHAIAEARSRGPLAEPSVRG
jgi:two-component system, cell cycle sensor histidine kinase and response regulator CckA